MPEYVLEIAPADPYVLDLGDDSPLVDAILRSETTPYSRGGLTKDSAVAARAHLELDGYPPFIQTAKPTQRRDGSALVVGDRWWSTLDNAWFYWSGTYWLSSQLFSAPAPLGGSASLSIGSLPQVAPQIFLESIIVHALFNGPQNTADWWKFTLERQTLNSSVVTTVAFHDANYFTQLTGDNQHKNVNIVLNLHQDLSALNAAGYRFGVYRQSAAGSVSGGTIILRYRIAK
jgi:hypothetical protein